MGAERLVEHAQASLRTDVDARSADGSAELEQVFCLGNCALGPAVTVNGRMYGPATAERLDALVEEARG